MIWLITAIWEDLAAKILKIYWAPEASEAQQGNSTSFPGSLFFYSIVGQGVATVVTGFHPSGVGEWGLSRDRSNWYKLLRYPCQNYAKVINK